MKTKQEYKEIIAKDPLKASECIDELFSFIDELYIFAETLEIEYNQKDKDKNV